MSARLQAGQSSGHDVDGLGDLVGDLVVHLGLALERVGHVHVGGRGAASA